MREWKAKATLQFVMLCNERRIKVAHYTFKYFFNSADKGLIFKDSIMHLIKDLRSPAKSNMQVKKNNLGFKFQTFDSVNMRKSFRRI